MERSLSDERLMERVRLGSPDAFRELMRRWEASLLRFFVLAGVRRSEVEDCVQETFLRLFGYRERYRSSRHPFRALLFRIGRNVSVDFFRRTERTRRVESLDAEPAVDDSVAVHDARLDVESALRELPGRLRWVVILNVFEGLSYRETAEVLGVPLGTVKSRMHHALLQLRERLRVGAG